MTWNLFSLFFIVSAACCSIGFKKSVYFVSAGYGLSVAGLGAAYLITILTNSFSFGAMTLLWCCLLIIYGLRLSGYLFYREIKSSSYRKILNNLPGNGDHLSFPAKFSIWVSVAVLYILQSSPIFFRSYNGMGNDMILPLIGIVISIAGLLLENKSDIQKSRLKKNNPEKPAMEGVYKLVRCPNYLGEMIFWTGVFISGLNTYIGAVQWLMAAGGYILIIAIMFGSAKRLEKRQESRYGQDPEYRRYADSTPILLPFVPLYTLGGKEPPEAGK